MATEGVKAEVDAVSNGSSLKVIPSEDDEWVLKSTFSRKPEDIEFKIRNDDEDHECDAKLLTGSTNSIPIDENNYIKLVNKGGGAVITSYHAIEIG